nr:XRE family transcriptional regulator [uncultured bacterium]BAH89468.1 XRE family transcriptional regulator [uncultured bacterium]BAH89700.1 XRE family transcriptional regulator [uncultured bacterium]BAH90185.1 XRE family transcriptional regulator [uncultured bacterium]
MQGRRADGETRAVTHEWVSDEPLRIGAKLRHARLMLGLSLCEVGERIGVTEGYLSKLENNRSQASMATLHRLVGALGMNMSELFATSSDDGLPITVVRAGNRPKLVTGHRRAGNQVTLERLVPGSPGQLLQINIHVIAPGGGSLEPASRHESGESVRLLRTYPELRLV